MDAAEAKTKAERIDQWQQRHAATAVPFAVVKKFGEDHSTNLASMMAFWAFFSIFPLLLAFVTLLGYFVPGDTKNKVLGHVAQMFPLMDVATIKGLSGSWIALIIGLASALWSGMAVVKTAQFAFNSVWEVPYVERPKFVEKVLRSLMVLATLGVGFVVSTLITSFVSGSGKTSGVNLGLAGIVGGYVLSLAFDIALFLAAYTMLTDRDLRWKAHLPGALLAGIGFFVLQAASSVIITRYVSNAQATYGKFYVVITILWWFYLQGQLTLLGAQVNAVVHEHLWPRSLIGGPDTPADHASYDAYAQERTYHETEEVDTTFNDEQPTTR